MYVGKQKRKGFILVETILYIMAVSIIVVSSVILIKYSIKEHNHISDLLELKEISYSVEDTIRMEMKNLVGVIYHTKNGEDDNGFIQIRELTYDIFDKDNKEVILRRKISLERNILYISEKGKYQIGNYINKIFYRIDTDLNNENNITKIEFKIIYKKGDSNYESNFTLVK